MRRNPRSAVGRDDIRHNNQTAVFHAIHHHGPISRTDLARQLRLSAAALTQITSGFIQSGIVYEGEQGVNTGVGRKPILLRVDYDYAFAVGVKVSDTAITTALTNLQADVIGWRKDLLDAHDVDSVIDAIAAAVGTLMSEHGVQAERVVGIGVNLPGIVDPRNGHVRASPLLGWDDTPIAKLLEDRLGMPALAENDVNAFAAASSWFGVGKAHTDFLVVTLGRGVGLGIVLNGRVYQGPKGGAGEFGHVVVDAFGSGPGPGRGGTIESLLADDALLARAKDAGVPLPDAATPADLLRLAERGDDAALRLYAQAGEVLGVALANLVNIFAPTLLILAGEGMRAARFLLPSAERVLGERSFCDLADQVEIVTDSWGDEAWAQGAAGLAASRFLTDTAPFIGGDRQPNA